MEDIYYRVHRDLTTSCDIVLKAGLLSTLDDISQKGIAKLLEYGAITKAIMPPLEIVVTDTVVLSILRAFDITTIAHLLSTDMLDLEEASGLDKIAIEEILLKVHKYLEPNKSAKSRR